MTDLLVEHAPDLAEQPSPEEFKREWPGLAAHVELRNFLFVQMRHFTEEFEHIIDTEWDRHADYRLLHPQFSPESCGWPR